MKASQDKKEDLIFMSEVLDDVNSTDFHVEIFSYSSDMKCDCAPVKVINNFDELINFFEEEDKS